MNSTQARAAIAAATVELEKVASHAAELETAWKVAAQAGDDSRCDEIEALQATLRRKQTRQEFLRDEAETKLAAALAEEETARREAVRIDGAAALKQAAKHSQAITSQLAKLGDELAAYQAAISTAAQAARVLSGNGFVSAPDAFRCAWLTLQHEGDSRRRIAEGLAVDERSFGFFVAAEHTSIASGLEVQA